MSLIHNERTKLLANALDRASTACLTVGVFAPIAAALYSATSSISATPVFIVGAVCWIFTAVVLHISARHILRRLQ
ncbi:hypothetical protein DEM27_10335 [Metarhizobium album]|uniref:Amino acid transporter n=1 Tax=Metarhizobium album TaxID=2182425 RepID=A0A2U2DTY8_9HYPH|nr:hypothetical protein DEM27_10335 [Rhizobium album]